MDINISSIYLSSTLYAYNTLLYVNERKRRQRYESKFTSRQVTKTFMRARESILIGNKKTWAARTRPKSAAVGVAAHYPPSGFVRR